MMTETPLAGWEFTLFTRVANGQDAWGQVGEPKETDAKGEVSWDNLEPGEYKVEETPSAGLGSSLSRMRLLPVHSGRTRDF
ncbi:MAG: prealbumin-like fold domain-containing protein [Bacillota bacterium]